MRYRITKIENENYLIEDVIDFGERLYGGTKDAVGFNIYVVLTRKSFFNKIKKAVKGCKTFLDFQRNGNNYRYLT